MKIPQPDDADFMERAGTLAGDRSFQLTRRIGYAATLLIAVGAPVDERRRLLVLLDEVYDLRPPPNWPVKREADEESKSKRMAAISEIDSKLRLICERYSVDLDSPLSPEMKRRRREVVREIERMIQPMKRRLHELKEAEAKAIVLAQEAEHISVAAHGKALEDFWNLRREQARLLKVQNRTAIMGYVDETP